MQVPAWHFLKENDVDCPAMLGRKCHSEVSVESRHHRFLQGPKLLICLHLRWDTEVPQKEGVIPLGLVVVKEHGVVYLHHQLQWICGMCRCHHHCCSYMRVAALDVGGLNMGDMAHAGVKSLLTFEGDRRHDWQSVRESDVLGDRFIVALAELGGGGLVHMA